MDRGAWQAMVHRIAESDTTEVTELTHMYAHTAALRQSRALGKPSVDTCWMVRGGTQKQSLCNASLLEWMKPCVQGCVPTVITAISVAAEEERHRDTERTTEHSRSQCPRPPGVPQRRSLPGRSVHGAAPGGFRTAAHSGILAWEIPWAGEPGGLQSMGSQSRTHD